jgi:hypothetical protein
MSFASKYWCKTGFSNYIATKRKHSNRPNAAPSKHKKIFEKKRRETGLRIENCKYVAY